jgi:hypothetical protein
MLLMMEVVTNIIEHVGVQVIGVAAFSFAFSGRYEYGTQNFSSYVLAFILYGALYHTLVNWNRNPLDQ